MTTALESQTIASASPEVKALHRKMLARRLNCLIEKQGYMRALFSHKTMLL